MIALDGKVNGTSDNGGDGKQELQYFDYYLTKDLTDLFASQAPIDIKLMGAAKQIVALRATKMSEKSWAHCVSIVCQKEIGMGLGGDAALEKVRSLKKIVDKAAGQGAPIGLQEYPKDVNELFNKLPDAYHMAFPGGQPPAKTGFY